ncbi:MAG: hypothetical protein KDB03_11870 [Planctomycetales bacterium]|nr:hypothetical protein [Planctomycetales bacterium]
MAFSSIELWQRLSSSGLASSQQCRLWATTVAEHLESDECLKGMAVLQKLVELGQLTKHQAKVLVGQRDAPLRIGSWIVLQPAHQTLFSSWWEAVSELGAQEKKLIKAVGQGELKELSPLLPSLSRVDAQSQIHHQNLQEVLAPELRDGQLVIALAMPGGRSVDKIAPASLSPGQILEIIVQLLAGLAKMHAHGLAHGRVVPSQIFLDARGVTLVRDPLCICGNLQLVDLPGLFSRDSDPLSYYRYAAPELAVPGQNPNATSDVYAVGCLWHWLASNKNLSEGSNASEILTKHLTQRTTPEWLTGEHQALSQVWFHCVAQDPSARFTDAGEALAALKLAQRIASENLSPTSPQPNQRSPKTQNERESNERESSEKVVRKQSTPDLASNEPTRVSKPTSQLSIVSQQVTHAQSSSYSSVQNVRSLKRQPRKSSLLLPAIGGCLVLIAILLILKASGVLQPAAPEKSKKPPIADYIPPTPATPKQAEDIDARLNHYQLVESSDGLWLPAFAPQPFPIDMLAPGSGAYLSLRPEDWKGPIKQALAVCFDMQLENLCSAITMRCGLTADAIQQVTVAWYEGQPDAAPPWAMRVTLAEPMQIEKLVTTWSPIADISVANARCFQRGADVLFVAAQYLDERQQAVCFSILPRAKLNDVLEMEGAEPPLGSLEGLWKRTSSNYDVSLLVAPSYLYNPGRGLLASAPMRLKSNLPHWLGYDTRGLLFQTQLTEPWYWEIQLQAMNQADSGMLRTMWQTHLSQLASNVEAWLANEMPHSSWRTIAIRLPAMLRSLNSFQRTGIENGVTIINCYLPASAITNLTFASWTALGDYATQAAPQDIPGDTLSPSFSIDEFLATPITVRFDQEPIEVALQLVATEANDQLHAGALTVSFRLDGDAFERAGITRNQQLRQFAHTQSPVRDALTEIARRGNTDPTVVDLHDLNQELVWLVRKTGENFEVLLTTRTAAGQANELLPAEFARP